MVSNNEYKVQSSTRFDASEISIISLKTNKEFLFERDNNLIGSNIGKFISNQDNYLIPKSQTGRTSGKEQYSVLVYDSINHLAKSLN